MIVIKLLLLLVIYLIKIFSIFYIFKYLMLCFFSYIFAYCGWQSVQLMDFRLVYAAPHKFCSFATDPIAHIAPEGAIMLNNRYQRHSRHSNNLASIQKA